MVLIEVGNRCIEGRVLAYHHLHHLYRIKVIKGGELDLTPYFRAEQGFEHVFYVPEANIKPFQDFSRV